MTIKTPFKFGDSAYIKNDPEQKEYLVTGIYCRPGTLVYELSYIGEKVDVYEFEITPEKNNMKFLGLEKEE